MVPPTLAERRISIPLWLDQVLRAWPLPLQGELVQIGGAIWITEHPVARHTDSTRDGYVSYGAVLINDPGYILIHDDKPYDIPAGSLYRIDGRIPHETRGGPGLFAVLIWDAPPTWDLPALERELLAEWSKR